MPRLLKRFCDSRWAWDLVQGPIYNRLIYGAASELYEQLASEIQPPSVFLCVLCAFAVRNDVSE